MIDRILYITNLPSPYKISYFNELAKYTDLTVVFERSNAKNRNPNWKNDTESDGFKQIYLEGINFGNEMSIDFSIRKLLKNYKDAMVLLNGYSSPTEMIAIQYMKKEKMRFGIVCDGLLEKQESVISKKIKRFLIKSAAFWMSSGLETDRVLIDHGAQKRKVFRYPFSSISESDVIDVPYDRKAYKEKIGCNSKYMILYVGQMIHRKGIDVLIEAVRKINLDFTLYMIGDEFSITDSNIVNIGFLDKEHLKDYYMAADVFVLPSREDIWGLVINEAMAYGTPVVASNRCGAAIEMIKNGHNGEVVPVEDVDALRKSICSVLCDYDIAASMCDAVKIAKRYSIEAMAKRTVEIIEVVRE